jgi:hypothetical protein
MTLSVSLLLGPSRAQPRARALQGATGPRQCPPRPPAARVATARNPLIFIPPRAPLPPPVHPPPLAAELQARLFQLRAAALDAIAANAFARRRVELLRAQWLACAALQHLSGVQPAENWTHLVLGLEEGSVRLAQLVHGPGACGAAPAGGGFAAAAGGGRGLEAAAGHGDASGLASVTQQAAAAAVEAAGVVAGPGMPCIQVAPLIERCGAGSQRSNSLAARRLRRQILRQKRVFGPDSGSLHLKQLHMHGQPALL